MKPSLTWGLWATQDQTWSLEEKPKEGLSHHGTCSSMSLAPPPVSPGFLGILPSLFLILEVRVLWLQTGYARRDDSWSGIIILSVQHDWAQATLKAKTDFTGLPLAGWLYWSSPLHISAPGIRSFSPLIPLTSVPQWGMICVSKYNCRSSPCVK